jgi:uncharacterized DUF497 family protein
MRFEFDPTKGTSNQEKHGVSLRVLYCVAFVNRGEARRTSSLRRANRREAKHYVESI